MSEDLNWWRDVPPPPPQYVNAEPFQGYARRIAEGWTLALCDRQEQITAAARGVPFFAYSAVGLLDPETDQGLREEDPRFGVILYAEGREWLDGDSEQRERIVIRSGDEYNDVAFPIVVRRGVFSAGGSSSSQTGGPAAGLNGTLACWSSWRKKQSGWLTARHCAASLGSVIDAASHCVDAALVYGTVPSASLTRWNLSFAPPSAGLAVHLGLTSGGRPTVVVNVSSTLGTKDSKFPLRFSTQDHGSGGDSGSLITESGQPFGLYLGAFRPVGAAVGSNRGYGLALSQLENLVDLEVFR